MEFSDEEKQLGGRLIPPVKEFKLISGEYFQLIDGCRIQLNVAEAEPLVRGLCRRFWNMEPEIVLTNRKTVIGPEAYRLEVLPECLAIEAAGSAGVRYALNTLRQLAETERGVLRFSGYLLPCVKIDDSPAMSFRGMHFCWFPETAAWEIEKELRLAAYYKFNYAMIEPWGVLQYQSHPEFCWDEYRVEPAEMRRLVSLGRELGITLIPQLNLFGHATSARDGSGKHVLLDFHPEFQSLFEPDGWSWCINNPAARNFLTDLVLELLDIFDQPPFFHIGCDEAYNAGGCQLCRHSDFSQKLLEHLQYFQQLLAERGVRCMMWHDMLLDRKDLRWQDYVAFGNAGLNGLYRQLSAETVICDWQYGYPEKDGMPPKWPTVHFFKDAGFPVIVCPWKNLDGLKALGQLAANEKLMGLLATTWHHNQSIQFGETFMTAARATWYPHAPESQVVPWVFMITHVRQVDQDAGIRNYTRLGVVRHQVNPNSFQG